MILGIGNDIVETERIQKALSRDGFLEKYFTKEERLLFERRHFNADTVGGNFSVKEAVSKALGTGIRAFGMKDIEVLRDDIGKPYVLLYNEAESIAGALGINAWHVSISHCKSYITAMAIGEKL